MDNGEKKTVVYAGQLEGETAPIVAELELEWRSGIGKGMWKIKRVVHVYWVGGDFGIFDPATHLPGRHFHGSVMEYSSFPTLDQAVEHIKKVFAEEIRDHAERIVEMSEMLRTFTVEPKP